MFTLECVAYLASSMVSWSITTIIWKLKTFTPLLGMTAVGRISNLVMKVLGFFTPKPAIARRKSLFFLMSSLATKSLLSYSIMNMILSMFGLRLIEGT